MRDAVTTPLKVRANRAGRVLGRMGHRLEKLPRRDPRAADFGLYRIASVAGAGPQPIDDAFGMTLAEVETWMEGAPAARPQPAAPTPRAARAGEALGGAPRSCSRAAAVSATGSCGPSSAAIRRAMDSTRRRCPSSCAGSAAPSPGR